MTPGSTDACPHLDDTCFLTQVNLNIAFNFVYKLQIIKKHLALLLQNLFSFCGNVFLLALGLVGKK